MGDKPSDDESISGETISHALSFLEKAREQIPHTIFGNILKIFTPFSCSRNTQHVTETCNVRYPNAVIYDKEGNTHHIKIKRLKCSISKHLEHLKLFQRLVDKSKYNNTIKPWEGNLCSKYTYSFISDAFEKSEFNVNRFYYLAYTMDQIINIYGWMVLEEFKTEGTSDNFIHVIQMATQGGHQDRVYQGIGTAMIQRLIAYCLSHNINYVIFHTSNRLLKKYGTDLPGGYYYFPITNEPSDKFKKILETLVST
jgi:hypothetical protein